MIEKSEIMRSVEETLKKLFQSWHFRLLAGALSALWVANVRFTYAISQDQGTLRHDIGQLQGSAEALLITAQTNQARIERLENITLFRMSILGTPTPTPLPQAKKKRPR